MTTTSSSTPRKKYDYAAEKKAMAELSDRLEEKYADAGLRIVQCFDGISPVQASGYLGSEVFYFRFRGDIASLQVGRPDYEKPKREKRDQELSYVQRLESAKVALDAGEISQDEYEETKWALSIDPPPREVDPLYPDIVSKSARIEGVTGHRHAGLLGHNHLEFIFCELMDSLAPSPVASMA
jgi:hypothetical protein